MDPLRTCINCQQRIRIVYQDGDSKSPLVFIVHTKNDFLTNCPGSRQLVDNQKIIGLVTAIDPLTKPAPQAMPETSPMSEDEFSVQLPPATVQPSVSKVPFPKKEKCPECKQDTRVKLNLRGSEVFIEHYNTLGRLCTQSLKPTQ